MYVLCTCKCVRVCVRLCYILCHFSYVVWVRDRVPSTERIKIQVYRLTTSGDWMKCPYDDGWASRCSWAGLGVSSSLVTAADAVVASSCSNRSCRSMRTCSINEWNSETVKHKADQGEVRPFVGRQRLGGAPSWRMECQVPSSPAEVDHYVAGSDGGGVVIRRYRAVQDSHRLNSGRRFDTGRRRHVRWITATAEGHVKFGPQSRQVVRTAETGQRNCGCSLLWTVGV